MWDTSQLRALESDLGKIPGSAFATVAKVVDKYGNDLKDAWVANAEATAGRTARQYPRFITAAVKPGLGTVGVEVGPEARGQGNLGLYLEYGSSNNPPHHDGNRAADVVEPKFAAALPAAIAALIERAL